MAFHLLPKTNGPDVQRHGPRCGRIPELWLTLKANPRDDSLRRLESRRGAPFAATNETLGGSEVQTA